MAELLTYYEIIQQALRGDITVEALLDTLKQNYEAADDKCSLVDDITDSLVQCDIESSLGNKESRERLVETIRTLVKNELIPATLAHERFELDTTHQVGIIQDKRLSTIGYNRLRTRLYFKQRKFNLLRESNEGFAKLLTELSTLDETNGQEVLKTVIEIVGTYSLDSNRVLDLILAVFEYNCNSGKDEFFINFIKSFYDDQSKLLQLIVLKMSFYASTNESLRHVPQKFYRMIAILIHKEVIDLDEVYPYLVPDDLKVLTHHKRLVEEAKHVARKYAMAVVGDEKPSKSVIDALKESSNVDFHHLEVDNQKVNLCAHLIEIGSWDQALALARKLPEFHCFSNRGVALATCNLISHIIDPLYRQCALPHPLNLRIRPTRIFDPEEISQINSVEDMACEVFPKLLCIGPFVSYDTLLLTKLIRLLKFALLHKPDENSQDALTSESTLYYQILDVISHTILPAISLTSGNCCLTRELWDLLRNFKYNIRYKLYYDWRYDGTNPVMLRNKGHILLRAKHHMKRLSKETLRPSGRNIGKLCYSNPVITLGYILIQIQSYDNLITLVIEALRFVTQLGCDASLYCTIDALSDPQKNKKSNDGMALAQWLTNLSTFSSSVILRYKVEFTSFLEYIANQLKVGNSLDLVLLADLIQKMTGIETIQAITDDRIEALMGGDVLRTEGAYFNQVKNTRKSSTRLKDALIESRLAMPLCILMAQLRDRLFFTPNDTGTPLKLVGKLYDQCQETFVQYGVFLSMNLSIDDYVNFLPPLEKLMTDHKLDPDTAFFLARPMIFHRIRSRFQELKEAAAKEVVLEEGEASKLSGQTLSVKFVEAARSVLDPIAETIQPILAEKYVSYNLNSKLFVIFWTLSMSDIEVPLNCYDREMARLRTAVSELSKSNDEDQKKRKERERCNNLIQKLKQERSDQIEHTKFIRMYLESERNNLFCNNTTYDNVYLESRQFVQHCPFARCLQTACDAVYSARFMLFLHELKVENYSTIICLDRLLVDLTYMMGACTENEANHYGRFLCNILKTTSNWHSSAEIYNRECEHFPGSIISNDNSAYINYESYRDICHKWHYRLTRSFSVALESNNYIQIRNALIVMISIIEYYPAVKHFGKGINLRIEEVRNNEKDNRPDLFALATAYAGRLDERKPNLIPESNFHNIDKDAARSSQKEKHSSSGSRKKARHT